MVRCGLIGCGKVVQEMHLPSLRAIPEVRVEAACDTDSARLQTIAGRHGIAKVATDLPTFLDMAPNLDFVIVATPGFTHAEVVRQLIEARIHVLVEKPVALSLSDAAALQNKARERGVKVCVGHTWRFRDPVVRAMEAYENGLVGTVYQTNVFHRVGSLFHCSEPEWCWQEQEHKVMLYEHAIHLLDLQVYFAGPVRAIHGIRVLRDPHLRVTTAVHGLIEHESGATSVVDLHYFSSSNFTQFEVYGSANDVQIKFFPHSYRLYSGRVNPLDELYQEIVRLRDYGWPLLKSVVRRPDVPRKALPHFRLLHRFVSSLRDNSTRVPVAIEDVLSTMAYLDRLSQLVYGQTSKSPGFGTG